MLFSNSVITPALVSLVTGILTAFAALIWWLLRKRQVRIWLPTVRILELEPRLLPRLLLRPPPWLLFVMFVLTAAAVMLMTLKPRVQVFTPFEPNQSQLHLFFDMSPSVAAHGDLDTYIQKATTLYDSLKEQGRISVSTSHGGAIEEPEDAAALRALLARLGFHRSGVRLGTILKTQLEAAGRINRLFIVSDRDQHSWSGFNWSYLLSDMDVLHVDLAEADTTLRRNVFISEARYLAAPGSETMEWDVEIARGMLRDANADNSQSATTTPEVSGTLIAEYRGEVLTQVEWTLAPGTERVTARANWPESKALSLGATKGPASGGKDSLDALGTDTPLVWRLKVNDAAANALTLDDEFRTELHGMRQDVLLISEAAGERPLEDPAHELEIALQVLGFRVKRHDFTNQPGPSPDAYPLWILVGGAGHGSDDKGATIDENFCPRSLELARLAARREQGARSTSSGTRWPKVWLVPLKLDADYEELCSCYGRLLLSQNADDPTPTFCQHVQTRAAWNELLPSVGAKQIGGELGDQAATLAWSGQDQNRLSVLAFTVPLVPQRATGITHAQLPLLVKELLTWQGLLQPGLSGSAVTWPRFEDIGILMTGQDNKAVPPELLLKLRQSNVPIGESLLTEVSGSSLPPRWSTQLAGGGHQLPAKKEREDPLPWLQWLVGLVLTAAAIEAAVLITKHFIGMTRQSPRVRGEP